MRNETNYEIIDYEIGMTNVNPHTGIRYGIIHHGKVGQAWYNISEPYYRNECLNCNKEIDSDHHDEICPKCEQELDLSEFNEVEPIAFFYEHEGYYLEQPQDDTDIWVFRSPYYTYAQLCSPCAPGAGHLNNPLDHKNINNKTYCLGHDWFEKNKAPYTVYDVLSEKRVFPE